MLQAKLSSSVPHFSTKESQNTLCTYDQKAKELFVMDITDKEQLKLAPIRVKKSNKEDDQIEGWTMLEPNKLLCLTSSGSVKCIMYKQTSQGLSIQRNKIVDYLCLYCGQLQTKSSQYITHVYLCHRGPAYCPYCNREYIDSKTMREHKKACKYRRTVENCSWQGSLILREYKRHQKKH